MTSHTPTECRSSRAAWLTALMVAIASAGCQSPWRSWRKNEPSLEQLLVAPQPWDAQLRGDAASDSVHPPATNHRSTGSRANPYAAMPMAKREVAMTNQRRDQSLNGAEHDFDDDEDMESQWEESLQDMAPEYRELAKQQFQAFREMQRARQRSSSASPERGLTSTAKSDGNSTGVTHRFSDRDEPADGDEPVVMSFRDHTEEEWQPDDTSGAGDVAQTPPNVSPRKQLQELKPPNRERTSRQVAHTKPVDSGAGDEMRYMPRQRQDSAAASPPSKTLASTRSGAESEDTAEPTGDGPHSDNPVRLASAERTLQPQVETKAAPTNAAHSTTSGTPTGKAMHWRDHIAEGLRLIENEAEQSTSDSPTELLHREAVKRLLHLSLGQLDPALKPIESLQTNEQEFFRHELQSLYNAIDPNGNPVLARRWALVMDGQRSAMQHLAAVSNLEIRNAAFCSNVDGYGAITRFPTTQFRANQELLLYCEIDNFVSEQVKDGFETRLQGNYEIVDANNVRVANVLLPEEVDICKRPRRDYFFVYRIYTPQRIDPGKYQLRLTIEDMKGRKYGQSSLDFQVVP